MKTIEVIILKGGITAKEINPFGNERPTDELIYTKGNTVIIGREKERIFKAQLFNWEKAEQGLRTFEIDSEEEFYKSVGGKEAFDKLHKEDTKITEVNILYQEGTKHKAFVLPSGKIKIIPDKYSFYETFSKLIDGIAVTEDIHFGYTNIGEPNFIKNGADVADKKNSISLRDWTPEQLESMAKFMRNNPLCKLMNDGSGQN